MFLSPIRCAVICLAVAVSACGDGNDGNDPRNNGGAGVAGSDGGGSGGAGAGTAGASGTGGTSGAAGGGAAGSGTAGTGGSAGSGSAGSGAGGAAGGAAGASGSGGSDLDRGECRTAADCRMIGDHQPACEEFFPGGDKRCTYVAPEVTECSGDSRDQCCNSSECGANSGGCFERGRRGCEPWTGAYNYCSVDECTRDFQCGINGFCTPPNFLGVPNRRCMTAYCKGDSDCDRAPGGKCIITSQLCCPGAIATCAYPPPTGCQTDADCTESNSACIFSNGIVGLVCVTGPIICL